MTKYFKIFLIIFVGLFLNTNAYSKALKTKVIFESENGGIYSFKNPIVSGLNGRAIDAFKKISLLSDKNCSRYSKNSFIFVANTSSNFWVTILSNGDLIEFGAKGFVPDYSEEVKLFRSYYRFYCGKNIEEVLVNHSIKGNLFPPKLFKKSVISEYNSTYAVYKDNKYLIKQVTDKNKNKIILKLKEVKKNKVKKVKTKDGVAVKSNIAYADYSTVISESKKVCKDIGYEANSDKFGNCVLELMNKSDGYEMAKIQENILITKVKDQENIGLEFSYETSSGQKIKKESKWTKFWQGAAWILYEYGDEIFAVVLDLKYDTNLSGYNTTSQVTSNTGGLKCVSQRVGNVIHQNCKGAGGTHIYCMYQKLGKSMVKRTCRDKSV